MSGRWLFRGNARNDFLAQATARRVRKRLYKTRELARADIFDCIEVFYNRTRRHSHLGGVSPDAFEQAAS